MTPKRIGMNAKFNSVCRGCYEPISAGEKQVVYLDRSGKKDKWEPFHPECDIREERKQDAKKS